ncbi:hypothetical protein CARUB_v10014951mg [Capsella rubella]|uniref:Embryo sac development arrest 6 n=1 Tax=Capsella rubella TaxID=81985 RepID=R0G7X6_9BRAS|nr:uncharacterized protein LOC17891346 [Capsella rubella]EOA31737.1 hypothetical protein CARUB_v10014951mg [Capsella rubella]
MNQNQYHQARGVQTQGASRKRKESESSDPRGVPSNWLLAGYMAHEFLTCGTMLGRKLYPGWAEVGPLVSPPPQQQQQNKEARKTRQSNYSDVAGVFKTDGNHVPGVVNPTQLAKWIQM